MEDFDVKVKYPPQYFIALYYVFLLLNFITLQKIKSQITK